MWHNTRKILDPQKHLFIRTKGRAKSLGYEFNLSLEDIIIPELCPILGIHLFFTDKKIDNTPSIDRIDNSKGYLKGNVRIISWRANQLKRDLDIKTTEQILKYMKGEI